ncbi:universal stress protein [Antarcticirhabdus aurantiaca]|uniref:Universal stress protein n=1 Tax=Antarcticirhabdus aurantiaca TaxID=2606717 RepID=A0ACD4NRB1_9HYPH|nr:universal stress protein [Antarcticirhabdus aurantiaca]WAJ29481.1 universal stress protein [Jeongeuplla avenae]
MSHGYKNILLPLLPEVEARGSPSPATKFAIDMAQRFSGFVSVDFLLPLAAWVPYSLLTDMPRQLLTAETKRLEEGAEASLRLAADAISDAGISVEKQLISLDFLALLGRAALRAQLQDVIVMDAGASALREEREVVEAFLFRTGRPLIRVPAAPAPGMPRNVLVAWDGSVPAARAVREALPILRTAERVEIVTVRGEKDVSDIAPGERLATYLDHHGVVTQQTILTAPHRDVAETLRDHAGEAGSDMIVMGAYAHSRLQQAVLGGVTTALLDRCPVPLLLAH